MANTRKSLTKKAAKPESDRKPEGRTEAQTGTESEIQTQTQNEIKSSTRQVGSKDAASAAGGDWRPTEGLSTRHQGSRHQGNHHDAVSGASLSRIDRNILRLLQRDARISFAELARQVGLTTTPCKERVKRLEREGYIRGYHAALDPNKLGKGLVVFVQITLQRTAGDAFSEFTEAIKDVPEVEECHLVAGNFDYLIKARVRDMAEYREFLGGSLMQLPGVQESTSYPVMESALER